VTGAVALRPAVPVRGLSTFARGLAAFKARRGSKLGFIDEKGQVAIAPRFAEADDFDCALTPAKERGGDWGLIDTTGAFVVPPQFNFAACYDGYIELHLRVGRENIRYWVDGSGRFVGDTPAGMIAPSR